MKSIEWAAGLFEGEGCISINRSRGNQYLTLSLQMVDEDVVRAFQEVVGIGGIEHSHPPAHKAAGRQPTFMWRVYGPKAEEVAWMLAPYLFSRRRKKLADSLTEIRQHRNEKSA